MFTADEPFCQQVNTPLVINPVPTFTPAATADYTAAFDSVAFAPAHTPG